MQAAEALKAAEQASSTQRLRVRTAQLSKDLAGCTHSWAHTVDSLSGARLDLAAKQAYLSSLQEQLRQDQHNQASSQRPASMHPGQR